jgi:hypothetical protein
MLEYSTGSSDMWQNNWHFIFYSIGMNWGVSVPLFFIKATASVTIVDLSVDTEVVYYIHRSSLIECNHCCWLTPRPPIG